MKNNHNELYYFVLFSFFFGCFSMICWCHCCSFHAFRLLWRHFLFRSKGFVDNQFVHVGLKHVCFWIVFSIKKFSQWVLYLILTINYSERMNAIVINKNYRKFHIFNNFKFFFKNYVINWFILKKTWIDLCFLVLMMLLITTKRIISIAIFRFKFSF